MEREKKFRLAGQLSQMIGDTLAFPIPLLFLRRDCPSRSIYAGLTDIGKCARVPDNYGPRAMQRSSSTSGTGSLSARPSKNR